MLSNIELGLYDNLRWGELPGDDHDDDHDHDHGFSSLEDIFTVSTSELQDTLASMSLTDASVLDTSLAGTSIDVGDTATNGFDFGITVVDGVGGIATEILELFGELTILAMQTWTQFLGGAEGASIEVQVNVGGTSAVASAGPGGIFLDQIIDLNGSGVFDTGDLVTAIAGTILELQTGFDPNGAAPDIFVNVNDQLLNSGAFFFDTTLEQVVPGNQFDFYSVILHELGHGLGFLGLSNQPGVLPAFNFGTAEDPIIAEVATLYDLLIQVDENGQPFFVGANAIETYGAPVPLEFQTGNPGSDISHVLGTINADGSPTDLRLALMNPFVIPGDRVDIGDLELAIMADIGHTITQLTGGLINEFDPLPDEFVPTATVDDGFGVGDGSVLVGVSLDQIPPFLGIASSVAVRVTGPTGASGTTRLQFLPGETFAVFGVDVATFFGIDLTDTGGTNVSGDLEVTLYNPAQADLANGEQSETITVTVNATVGTTGDDDIDGGNGRQTIFADDGNDEVNGGNGNDFADGGAGDDDVSGGNGRDTVLGGEGNDFVDGGNGNDVVGGGAGNDTLLGGNGRDTVDGGAGDDEINGANGNDLLIGGAGDDTIIGGNGNDVLISGSGIDVLTGGNGRDDFDVTDATVATITDLNFRGRDEIIIGDTTISNAGELNAFIDGETVFAETSGDDLIITFGAEQTLIIEDGADLFA